MDVNITKEKKLTNMRQSNSDETEKIVPPRKLSLEQCLEFCREDECVEVTPAAVRIRKVVLSAQERARTAARPLPAGVADRRPKTSRTAADYLSRRPFCSGDLRTTQWPAEYYVLAY